MIVLPAKTPTEAKVVTFDFSLEAAAGTTFSAALLAKSLISGTDTGAATLLLGSPMITGQKVLVLVSGGLEGSNYQITCEVSASNSEVHDIAVSIAIAASAA